RVAAVGQPVVAALQPDDEAAGPLAAQPRPLPGELHHDVVGGAAGGAVDDASEVAGAEGVQQRGGRPCGGHVAVPEQREIGRVVERGGDGVPDLGAPVAEVDVPQAG